jgi:hypothetical protein
MGQEPATSADDAADGDQEGDYPKHIQHKWPYCDRELLERLKEVKEEYGLTWKQLLVFAEITLQNGDPETTDRRIARTLREFSD